MNDNIQIRQAQREELPVLEQKLSAKGIPWFHKEKIDTQEHDKGIWLIAWHDNQPVGHFQVRWTGSQDAVINMHLKNYAHLEAGGVKEEYRRQGIGTKLIQESEKLAKARGFHRIGMAVGSSDNPNARRLYEKLGYTDWGHGEFITQWEYLDEKGERKFEKELCIYLTKKL